MKPKPLKVGRFQSLEVWNENQGVGSKHDDWSHWRSFLWSKSGLEISFGDSRTCVLAHVFDRKKMVSYMCGLARNSIFLFDGHLSSNGPVSVVMLVFRNGVVCRRGIVEICDVTSLRMFHWRFFLLTMFLSKKQKNSIKDFGWPRLNDVTPIRIICIENRFSVSSASGNYHEFIRLLCMVHINIWPVLSTVAQELGMMCFTTLKATE